MEKILKVHPSDNIIVALQDLHEGDLVVCNDKNVILQEMIPSKHKFAEKDFQIGDTLTMYGVTIGTATELISKGSRIGVHNVKHSSESYELATSSMGWTAPEISHFKNKTFHGYHRKDGKVGTRNYWLVIPLVFCENRNLKVIESIMLERLGYANKHDYSISLEPLIEAYKSNANSTIMEDIDVIQSNEDIQRNQLFKNVDGIKFLAHDGGCGGIRQDSEILCNLLAGYIANPNVAGATVLSLGCQNAQFQLLETAIKNRYPNMDKPVFVLEQQKSNSEREFIAEAVKKTFIGLTEANKCERKPAGLEHLVLGLECGGSDGFSGISANPALGYCSDILVSLGGKAILSEFPELNGVEQEIIHRCVSKKDAEKFANLMNDYSKRAEDAGSGFDMNPSPGNIKDGLITDAMKSAGAAKKGGSSPIQAVLDYTEQAVQPGLNLLCTPGNDVESTTGLAGSGANLIVFTTGLGTPTGNPIAPTIKMSSNSLLAEQMRDLIDIDAGSIISGQDSIVSKGEELMELLIHIANGDKRTKAEYLGQDDFIPWKRGISL